MPPRHLWPWIGGVVGLLVGLFDALFFMLLGLEVTFRGGDPTAWLVASYAATYGILGFLLGRWLQVRRDLRESEKLAALGRMAAGVAHEVRNPLAVIRSSAGLLLEGMDGDDDDGRKAAQFITDEVDRLDAFVRALLDYSRPLEASRQPTPLGALVSELAGRTEVAFEAEVADGTTASADPVLLSQLLLSLVVNASEAECARIAVRARRDGRDVLVDVADDGPGVDPGDAERIFEPFFTTKARGTGLGLPMAARTAEALGGTLQLASGSGLGDEGRGACFRVRLPAVTA